MKTVASIVTTFTTVPAAEMPIRNIHQFNILFILFYSPSLNFYVQPLIMVGFRAFKVYDQRVRTCYPRLFPDAHCKSAIYDKVIPSHTIFIKKYSFCGAS